MLQRQDDAFATGLRLIGRCVANGANIGPVIKCEIARRLANFWVRAPLHGRLRVGRLIVEDFSIPLGPQIRALLGLGWLIDFGAGEIVSRENDAQLTMDVLTALLDGHIHTFTRFHTLQPALNRVGDQVFRKYCEKARRTGTTAEELSGLTNLIGDLDPGFLTPGIGLDLALDETLPDALRLEAFCLSAPPLHGRAWPIVQRVLASANPRIALKAIGRTGHPETTVLQLLRDPTIGAEQRRCLIRSPTVLFPDGERRCSFIRRCANDKALTSDVRDIAEVFAVRYGDSQALQNLLRRFETLELQTAEAAIALLGHHRSRDLGVRAAEAARSRVTIGEEAAGFAREAVNGLMFVFQMDLFRGGTLVP
jgi:hypothetical protein